MCQEHLDKRRPELQFDCPRIHRHQHLTIEMVRMGMHRLSLILRHRHRQRIQSDQPLKFHFHPDKHLAVCRLRCLRIRHRLGQAIEWGGRVGSQACCPIRLRRCQGIRICCQGLNFLLSLHMRQQILRRGCLHIHRRRRQPTAFVRQDDCPGHLPNRPRLRQGINRLNSAMRHHTRTGKHLEGFLQVHHRNHLHLCHSIELIHS